MEARAVNQPDFLAAASSLRLVADNLALCANMPAVDSGQQILRALARMDEKLARMDEKLDALNRKVDASVVLSGEMALSPLYSLETGQEIPHCPATLADLELLSNDQAATLLRQLDETVPRGSEQRIRRLKLAFGIRTRLV
ncbi:hypothetical protein MY1884_009760 [Beauveria asiatica]